MYKHDVCHTTNIVYAKYKEDFGFVGLKGCQISDLLKMNIDQIKASGIFHCFLSILSIFVPGLSNFYLVW